MDVRRWKRQGAVPSCTKSFFSSHPQSRKIQHIHSRVFPKMGYPLFGRHIHLPWSSRHASMAIPSSTHRRYKAWPKVEAVKGCAKIFVVEAAHFLIHDAMNPYKRNQRCGNFILKFCDSEPKLLWKNSCRITWKPSSPALLFFKVPRSTGHTFDPLGFMDDNLTFGGETSGCEILWVPESCFSFCQNEYFTLLITPSFCREQAMYLHIHKQWGDGYKPMLNPKT